MGKLRRVEDEADKWLREHDPYFTDKTRGKSIPYPYQTPQQEERQRAIEIPTSALSIRQRDTANRLSTFTDDFI